MAIVPAAVDTTAKGTRHIGLKAVSDEEYFIGGYATKRAEFRAFLMVALASKWLSSLVE